METTTKKIVDFRRMVLFTDGVDGKRARFQFGIRDGYPRVTVFTGTMGKEGVISGPMDVEAAYAYAEKLTEISKGPNDSRYVFTLKTAVYENDKPTKDKKILSQLFLGKDEKGIVWTGLQAEGQPKLKFSFGFTDYIELRKGDGSHVSEQEISAIAARAYATILIQMVANYLSNMPPELPGGGAGAPMNKKSAIVEEDIQF